MTGLVAVVAAPDSAQVQESEATELAAAYEYFRPLVDTPRRMGNDRVRVVHFEPSESSASPTDSRAWVARIGSMKPSGTWSPPFARHVEHVDGQFAVVAYDAEHDEVVIANDPMGMRALYVAERPGRLYVSTSALVLARYLGCQASTLGVQEFLVSGYQFGSHTHWDDVRRLDPATCIIVSSERVGERTYWRPRVDPSVRSLTLRQASDHNIEVARSVCHEYLAGAPTWVDLTGGYDSRLACLLLESAGVEFATNTRSAPSPDDVQIARRVAAAKGWTWLHAQLPPEWPVILPRLLGNALAWGDGQLEVLQLARVLYAHGRLAELGSKRLVSGGGGEHFQYYAWQSEFLKAGRSSSFDMGRWLDMIALKPTDLSVLAHNPLPEVRDSFATRFSRWIHPYSGEQNTTQLEIMYAYKCMGHFGAYRSADESKLIAELPFYYKRIISAAMSTNYRHRNGHRLMRHMIARLDVGVASLPTTRGGPALPWRPSRAYRYLPYFGVVGRKGINKLSQRSLGRTLLARSASFPWQAAANGAVLTALQQDGIVDHGQMRIGRLLNGERLQTLMAESLRPNFAHSAMLGRIITAEMALRSTDTSLD